MTKQIEQKLWKAATLLFPQSGVTLIPSRKQAQQANFTFWRVSQLDGRAWQKTQKAWLFGMWVARRARGIVLL